MAFPADYANMPVVGKPEAVAEPTSDADTLAATVDAIVDAVSASKSACILPGIMVSRFGLSEKATAVVDASGLPFATMFMDKCVLDETHANYIGMYDGKLMNEQVRSFVEGCDCVLAIGTMATDLNTGCFTATIDRSKSINILQHHVRVGAATYANVEMEDVLVALSKKLSKRTDVQGPSVHGLGEPVGKPGDKISVDYLYPRWQQMLKPGDVLIAETGTCSMGLGFAKMPKGSTYQNQTLWGSIGWATPAAFGAAMAAPDRRTILVTGDGSHQLTAQEVSQFGRFGLKPIIFVLSNSGYLIERLLCKDPETYYNDIAEWHYHKLPEALGCDGWFTARVTTCGELDEAIKKAEACGTGVYIEVVTEKYEASQLSQRIHNSIATLYK